MKLRLSARGKQRYHLAWRLNGIDHSMAMIDGSSPAMDRDIALLLSGRWMRGMAVDSFSIVECNLERCPLCAIDGYSLDVPYVVGSFVLATTGEYSDYGVGGLYQVARAFLPETFPDAEAAASAGYLVSIPYREFWAGD